MYKKDSVGQVLSFVSYKTDLDMSIQIFNFF